MTALALLGGLSESPIKAGGDATSGPAYGGTASGSSRGSSGGTLNTGNRVGGLVFNTGEGAGNSASGGLSPVVIGIGAAAALGVAWLIFRR